MIGLLLASSTPMQMVSSHQSAFPQNRVVVWLHISHPAPLLILPFGKPHMLVTFFKIKLKWVQFNTSGKWLGIDPLKHNADRKIKKHGTLMAIIKMLYILLSYHYDKFIRGLKKVFHELSCMSSEKDVMWKRQAASYGNYHELIIYDNYSINSDDILSEITFIVTIILILLLSLLLA